MEYQDIEARVRQELSEKRFVHTLGVVETAVELAKWSGVDEESARVAAVVHDIAREWPMDELMQFAERIEIPQGFASIPELVHGPVAAQLLFDWFEIDSEEIANSIRYHTTGRLNMTSLEMVICLADAIEPNRNYEGVDEIRGVAKSDLRRALAMSFDSTIRYLLETHQPVFPLTVMARNELWETLLRN